MKICIILGTRPEIIKMSPIIKECKKRELDYFILHTNQHYSYNLDKVFFRQLDLPDPKYNLEVGSGFHGQQTGKALIKIEKILRRENPDIALVEGDTNTVLAGALAASKNRTLLGHVEAGLRSFDRTMPEEINRILADHCSDYLFAPTSISKNNLLNEGIPEKKIYVIGNTIVDAIKHNINKMEREAGILDKLELNRKDYFLATIHRQENVDNKKRFSNILKGLTKISKEFGIPVVYPVHPRSKKRMNQFGLQFNNVRFIDPVDYFSFLNLVRNAKVVLTDSGGVQEESCILSTPCVTLRYNTERPETLEVGSNILAGTKPNSILECVRIMNDKQKKWDNPFGDGKAGEKIVKILVE